MALFERIDKKVDPSHKMDKVATSLRKMISRRYQEASDRSGTLDIQVDSGSTVRHAVSQTKRLSSFSGSMTAKGSMFTTAISADLISVLALTDSSTIWMTP